MSKDKPDFNKGLDGLDEETAREIRAARILTHDLITRLDPEDIDGFGSLLWWLNEYIERVGREKVRLDFLARTEAVGNTPAK